MNFIEKVGKNLEVITTDALIELGATRDEVIIEVLDKGSKGFLGFGARQAKVRVTVKEEELEIHSTESIKEELPKIQVKEEVQKQSKPEHQVSEQHKETTKVVTEEPSKMAITKEVPQKEVAHESDAVATTSKEIPKNKPVISTDEAVEHAKSFLTRVLKEMAIEPTFEVKAKDKRINIAISGDKMGVVIGKRGETLDALQYLVNIAVNKGQEGYIKIMLDTENYRARREETLRKVAYKIAKKATETKKPVSLEPMNPYDRRIIHSVLQNSKFVKTHSEGREPYRKVVVTPIGEQKNNKS